MRGGPFDPNMQKSLSEIRAFRDGDKMRSMVRNAEQEIKKEYRAFVGKEGA